jgi:hypothetical protein
LYFLPSARPDAMAAAFPIIATPVAARAISMRLTGG